MKKITGQFTKYTVILLIVGAILVLVGGLSVGRKAISNQREIALDMTAKTRVDVISKENTELREENTKLKKEIEQYKEEAKKAKNEKNAEDEKLKTALAIKLAENSIKANNLEEAEKEIEKVDKEVLSSLPEEYKKCYDEVVKKLNK